MSFVPAFLLTRTQAFRTAYARNREPFLIMGLGVTSIYLGLLAISKAYESSKLVEEIKQLRASQLAITSSIVDDSFLKELAVRSGGKEEVLKQSLVSEVQRAITRAREEIAENGWLPDISLQHTPLLDQVRKTRDLPLTSPSSVSPLQSSEPVKTSELGISQLSPNTPQAKPNTPLPKSSKFI